MAEFWAHMYDDPYALKRIEKACELLKKHVPWGTIVEVGSFKEKARSFLTSRYTYIPYDYRRYTIHTNKLDLNKLNKPFKIVKFCDAILCLEVLEHLVRPERVLKKLKTHLKPDGIFIISLPNEATLFHRIRSLLGTIDAESFSSKGKHLHLPNFRQSRDFLQRLGQILECQPYINPSAKDSRQAQWFGWMKLLPDWFWQILANWKPSLFARGWIFVLKPYVPKNRLQNVEVSN